MSCFGRRQNGNRVGNAEVCVLNSFLSLSRLDIFSVSSEFCIPHRWKQTQPTLLFVLVLCLLYLFVCLIITFSNLLFAFTLLRGCCVNKFILDFLGVFETRKNPEKYHSSTLEPCQPEQYWAFREGSKQWQSSLRWKFYQGGGEGGSK